MRGYLDNAKATDRVFRGGRFHSGDLGVLHPDGYMRLADRSEDIISRAATTSSPSRSTTSSAGSQTSPRRR